MGSTNLFAKQDLILRNRRLSAYGLISLSRGALVVSMMMLAVAPWFVPDTYSVVAHTLSESGGQGVDGAWVFRLGLIFAASAVVTITSTARAVWSPTARWWMNTYAFGVVLLAIFPESPFDPGPYNEMVQTLHTASGAIAAIAFILGIATVSISRPHRETWTRAFDWIVIAAVAVIPQVMLVVTYPGALQRAMVFLGYVWLLIETMRIARQNRATSLT
ncbi:MAG: DUF998 domain-containing protein [Acidimicrobiia bacterium]